MEKEDRVVEYVAYVGGVFLSPKLDWDVSFHSGMDVAMVNCAGLTVYDHRSASITAVADWQHADLDWKSVRRAFYRPAFVQVKRKNGGEYLVLLPISKIDRESKLEAENPHFLLSLWKFPDGGPVDVFYDGHLWLKRHMEPNCWDEEMIAVTTGYIPNNSSCPKSKTSLPPHLMVFQAKGQKNWFILGSMVTQTDDLGDLYS